MARRKQKQEQPVADDAVVKVAITALVEADYEQRGVFPELRRRLTNWRPSSMSGGFWISVDLAVQVARDASAQHISYCEKKPDLSDAYMALMLETVQAIKLKREGRLWKDPGVNEFVARKEASYARWKLGDLAYYFGDEMSSVEVIREYGHFRVITPDGHFLCEETGNAVDYRLGYVVRNRQTKHEFFVQAGQLTDEECAPSHLRLVWTAPPDERKFTTAVSRS